MPNSSILPIDRNLSGVTTTSDCKEGVLRIPHSSALMKPRYQIASCHIQHTRWGSCTPLLICSRCILLPQLTGPDKVVIKS